MVVHGQIPRRPDFGGRIGVRNTANPRTKQAQQETAPGMKWNRAWSIKHDPDNLPYGSQQLVAKVDMVGRERFDVVHMHRMIQYLTA